MAPMSIIISCLLGLTMSVRHSLSDAARDDDFGFTQANRTEISHPVEILLTRHGVSCANIVNYFTESISLSSAFGGNLGNLNHARMKDPMLCEAGKKFANSSKQTGTVPDAIISSVLVRAIETAINQFGSPVYVAPFIREAGLGKDNQWNDRSTQLRQLSERYGTNFQVNYKYAELLTYEPEGDWTKFINFLGQTFLPDLVRDLGKSSGEPIVLAVVSHSNFMLEGEVFDACSNKAGLFQNNPKKPKPRNNQVVKLSYRFSSEPRTSEVDLTPATSLLPEGGDLKCEPAGVDGVSLYKNAKETVDICRSDIGDMCEAHILQHGSLPATLEGEIEKLNKKVLKKKAQIEKGVNKADKLLEIESEMGALVSRCKALKDTPCWYSNAFPDASCESLQRV